MIISINKKHFKIVLFSLLLLFIGICAFCFIRQTSLAAPVPENAIIEIFDVGRGEVVKRIKPDRTTRRKAEKLIGNISGTVLKFKPLPEKGYIIRIPLEPSIKVKNRFANERGIYCTDVLFLLLPDEGRPYLLILDEWQKPWFFEFEGDMYFSHFM